MDLAASIQKVTEEIMLKISRHVHKTTGEKNLCLAGGVALNCVANGHILREGPFENIWIQPASGDAGAALGAALAIWHKYLGNKRTADGKLDFQKASLSGPEYSDEEIGDFLKSKISRLRNLTTLNCRKLLHNISRKAMLSTGFRVRWSLGRAL
jgi:carbamoyltransferase